MGRSINYADKASKPSYIGKNKKKTWSINDFRKQSAEYFKQSRVNKHSTYAKLEQKSKQADREKHFTVSNKMTDEQVQQLLAAEEEKRRAAELEEARKSVAKEGAGDVKPQGRKKIFEDDDEEEDDVDDFVDGAGYEKIVAGKEGEEDVADEAGKEEELWAELFDE